MLNKLLISEDSIPFIEILTRFWLFLPLLDCQLYIYIAAIVKTRPTIEIIYWFAPVANPIPIDRNIYVSSSGSFTGVLNLTIDRAPTSPRERARDDFTTAIIKVVAILRRGNILASDSGLDKLCDFDL